MSDQKLLARQALHGALATRHRAGIAKSEPLCVYDLAKRLEVEVRFHGGNSFGGVYAKASKTILVPSLRPSGRRAFTGGHELGHWYFGHGTRIDEFEDSETSYNSRKPEERLANLYSAYLLMPPWAVREAFIHRNLDPSTCSPVQIFTVASQLGVGYETLIQHACWSLEIVPIKKASELLKVSPKDIKHLVLGQEHAEHLIITDKSWNAAMPIDLEIGDRAIVPLDLDTRTTSIKTITGCSESNLNVYMELEHSNLEAQMKEPQTLNDREIVISLRQNIRNLSYNLVSDEIETYETQLVAALDHISDDPDFPSSEFSLLRYSARCREAGGKDRLFELWRVALVGALHLLKFYDRRDAEFGEQRKVTPPVVAELVAYYEKLRMHEALLYGADEWYRDHFAHVLRVWMVGILVVSSLEQPGEIAPPPLTNDSDLDRRAFKIAERVAMFTVAALTHDMGYPLEKMVRLNSAVAELLEAFGSVDWQRLKVAFSMPQHQVAQDLLRQVAAKPQFRRVLDGNLLPSDDRKTRVKHLLDLYDQIQNAEEFASCHDDKDWGVVFRCQWKYFQKYGRSLEKNEHGFLSALLLQRKALYFREGEFSLEEDHSFNLEEARQFMIRREILRAVASHTCPDIFFLSPLSAEALLYFCDEIQDWGRPYFSDLVGGDLAASKPRVVLHSFTSSHVEWEFDYQRIDVSAFAAKVLALGNSLYKRLRSAPAPYRRKFSVKWKLSSRDEKLPFIATFSFDKNQFEFAVRKTPDDTPIPLLKVLDGLLTGKETMSNARKQLQMQLASPR